MLEARDISFHAGGQTLLHPTSLLFEKERFHVIMGANGAGKSTLLKILAGDQPPATGSVSINGRMLAQYSKKELATVRSVLSQHYHLAFPISVQEIVLMGRYPYFSTRPGEKDRSICDKALRQMGVHHLGERDYTTLSGGEAQKVQMSRVLAQIWERGEGAQKILFLDEPVSHLDIRYQYQLLQVAKSMCDQYTTVVAILHDINLSLSFADRILFMKEGKLVHRAETASEVTTSVIDEVFEVRSRIIHPADHRPIVIFDQEK